MAGDFLLYGATGFVGGAIAERALQSGLRPLLAGRDGPAVRGRADALGLDRRVFALDEPVALDAALADVPAVLHCAGPFRTTWRPMVEACLRTGTHYLDLTGEIPVFEGIYALSEGDLGPGAVEDVGVMLLPGVGFDVVPTDCLALHLKRRLPTATRLRVAFQSVGPAGPPPGTVETMLQMIPYGDRVRRDGRIVQPDRTVETRDVDFGEGPVRATRITWGDVFTAYHTTGIPDVRDYVALPAVLSRALALVGATRPFFRLGPVRALLRALIPSGSTAEERARTVTHVWAEVKDEHGGHAAARMHGPEAGVEWTAEAALAAVRAVRDGRHEPGFQTPARVFGPDFALECEGVTREDVR